MSKIKVTSFFLVHGVVVIVSAKLLLVYAGLIYLLMCNFRTFILQNGTDGAEKMAFHQ